MTRFIAPHQHTSTSAYRKAKDDHHHHHHHPSHHFQKAVLRKEILKRANSIVKANKQKEVKEIVKNRKKLKKLRNLGVNVVNIVPQPRKQCKYYNLNGWCRAGDNCLFIHDERNVNPCKSFIKGSCTNSKCLLRHEIDPNKSEDCTYFANGVCLNDHCTYRHVKLSDDVSICSDFQNGICTQGINCEKRHQLKSSRSKNASSSTSFHEMQIESNRDILEISENTNLPSPDSPTALSTSDFIALPSKVVMQESSDYNKEQVLAALPEISEMHQCFPKCLWSYLNILTELRG